MFNLTVKRPLTGFVLSSLVVTVWAACSADDSVMPPPSTSSTTAAGTGGNGGSTAATSTGTAGQGGSGGSGVGSGGSAGSDGSGTTSTGGSAGSAGAGGTGGTRDGGGGGAAGGKDAGAGGAPAGDGGLMCTPIVATPDPTTGFVRTGWVGQWTPMCNFNTGNGSCPTFPPANAFDGKSNRTTIGDTHLATGTTAQMIGDTFTFDMQTCHAVSRIEMYCADPPNNNGGGLDRRDYPGTVEVSVSSDCTSTAGVISGTFTPFVPALTANEPLGTNGMGCSLSVCTGPFVVTFPPGTAARCVRMRLTKILAAGGGVWWAIDELYVR